MLMLQILVSTDNQSRIAYTYDMVCLRHSTQILVSIELLREPFEHTGVESFFMLSR